MTTLTASLMLDRAIFSTEDEQPSSPAWPRLDLSPRGLEIVRVLNDVFDTLVGSQEREE